MNGWGHLQQCRLGLVPIHIRGISGERGRSLVEFEYPDRDGAEHQDMGRKRWSGNLDAVFFGPLYELHYQSVVALMDQAEPVLFTHPHHGLLLVRIETIQDRTSTEGAKYIEADIQLVESSLDTTSFAVSPAGVAGVANLLDAAIALAQTYVGALG